MVKKQKEEQSLNPQITIWIQDNRYDFDINNLTYGNLIDIEKLKITLSQDTHKAMLFTTTRMGQLAYLATDMISTFTILFPKLIEDLNISSLLDLSPLKTKELIQVYSKSFYPWWSTWEKSLNEESEEEKQALEFEEDQEDDDK